MVICYNNSRKVIQVLKENKMGWWKPDARRSHVVKTMFFGTSLVVQWLRICLPMQGIKILHAWATRSTHHNERSRHPHSPPSAATKSLWAAPKIQHNQIKCINFKKLSPDWFYLKNKKLGSWQGRGTQELHPDFYSQRPHRSCSFLQLQSREDICFYCLPTSLLIISDK